MSKRTVKPKHALRDYRVEQNLSADEVAKKLDIAASTLRSFENGNREVDGDMAVKIEGTLGIDRAKIRPDLFERESRPS